MKNIYYKVFPAAIVFMGVFIFVLVSWYLSNEYFENKEPTSGTSNTNGVFVNASKISLVDVCDCYLATGNYFADEVYDSTSGQKLSYAPITDNTPVLAMEFSPSLGSVAAITNAGKNVQIRLGPKGKSETVLTTSEGMTASWLKWSGDEKTLIVGTQRVQDFVAAEGARPTEIISIDLTNTLTKTIVSYEQTKEKKIDALYPLGVSNDAKRILLSAGTLEDQNFWIWSFEQGLRPLDHAFRWAVYSASAHHQGRSMFVTLDDGLRVFDVETETEKVFPITGWSDSPVSQPSPNGEYVVYLRRDGDQQRGYLTLLSLATGFEKRLSATPLGEMATMAGSLWTPDSVYFLFHPTNADPFTFQVVEVNNENQLPRDVELPSIVKSKEIKAILPKGE